MEMNDGPSGFGLEERHLPVYRLGNTGGIHQFQQVSSVSSPSVPASPNPNGIKGGIWGNVPENHYESYPTDRPPLGKIRDTHQQVWILQNGTLIATPYGENVNPVTLEVLLCRDDSLPKDKGKPIYLGIKASGLCLCCVMNGDQPTLQLVEKNIVDLYETPEAVKPFVFYLTQTGSTSTLESAAYSGWFIGTSLDNNQPVTLTQNLGSQYNTDFYLEIENPKSEPLISA